MRSIYYAYIYSVYKYYLTIEGTCDNRRELNGNRNQKGDILAKLSVSEPIAMTLPKSLIAREKSSLLTGYRDKLIWTLVLYKLMYSRGQVSLEAM